MRCCTRTAVLGLASLWVSCSLAQNFTASGRQPLSYASLPDNVYVAPKRTGTLSLLDFVESRPELSSLLAALHEPSGMSALI